MKRCYIQLYKVEFTPWSVDVILIILITLCERNKWDFFRMMFLSFRVETLFPMEIIEYNQLHRGSVIINLLWYTDQMMIWHKSGQEYILFSTQWCGNYIPVFCLFLIVLLWCDSSISFHFIFIQKINIFLILS